MLWDGRNDSGEDVASGIYFYQLKVENHASGGVRDFAETKKLLLLKQQIIVKKIWKLSLLN
jgi:hypothetical protein